MDYDTTPAGAKGEQGNAPRGRGTKPLRFINKDGLIHLYTGFGKGKTTCAAGLALRVLGHGGRVLFCQFLKGGVSGEIGQLEHLGAEIIKAHSSGKFLFQMSDDEKAQAAMDHSACFGDIRRRVGTEPFDLLVLDEIIDAVNEDLIPLAGLLALIRERPAGLELVLTGRNPPAEIAAIADYNTDFVCVHHPYQEGIGARAGIEY